MLTTMKSFLIGTLWFSSLLLPIQGIAKEPKVDIRTAGNYVVLAKTGIATIPTSVVTGDIAVSPIAATAMTGFDFLLDSTGTESTSTQFTGKASAASYLGNTPTLLTTAVSDMELAYLNATGRDNTDADRIVLLGGQRSALAFTPVY